MTDDTNHTAVRADEPISAKESAHELRDLLEFRKKLEQVMAEASTIRTKAVAEADEIIAQALATADQLVEETNSTAAETRLSAEQSAERILSDAKSDADEASERAARALAAAEQAKDLVTTKIDNAEQQADLAAQESVRQLEEERGRQLADAERAYAERVQELENITREHVTAAVAQMDAWRKQYTAEVQAEWEKRVTQVEEIAVQLKSTIRESADQLAGVMAELSTLRTEAGVELPERP